MNTLSFFFISISISLFLLISNGALAADIEAGRVAATQCAMCHGADGNGNGIPGSAIAGMKAEVFKKHLLEFKNGTRRNYMMEMFVDRLSDEDFDNLAAYYAIQKEPLEQIPAQR